jgi:hypothetical protein
LQALIELANLPEEEIFIINSVKYDCIAMCMDNNATHVIQRILICIEESKRLELNMILLSNLKNLIMDCNGICVIKKLINSNKSEVVRHKILEELVYNGLEYIQSPFGNYAVQHVLQEWGFNVCVDILNIINDNIYSLSMQKFSANVIEKCLELANKETRDIMINELYNPGKLLGLLKNKYGKIILHKTLNYLSYQERFDKKQYLISKINVTSSKERYSVDEFLETLYCDL